MDSVISKTTTYEAVAKSEHSDATPTQNSHNHNSHLPHDISRGHSLSHPNQFAQPKVLSTSVFESMQAQLKTREGELAQLLSQVEAFKRSRLHMSEEIVQLSNQNQTLKQVEEENNNLKVQIEEVEKKHNLTLMMLGEKQEQIEELRMDLMDVKEMFKSQTEDLIRMNQG